MSACPAGAKFRDMRFSRPEVTEILRRIGDGASVTIGGSRAHQSWTCQDGAWVCESFDEGYVEVHPSSREEVRKLIRRRPDAFKGVLKAPRWARFSAAFLQGDAALALEHLAQALRYGDSLEQGKLLRAFLWFPTRKPTAAVRGIGRSKLRGYTAYHVFMDAAGWDRSPEVGRKGVLFVDRLIDMVGDTEGALKVRASFHEQAGDLASALRDHEHELARAKPGTFDHELLTSQVERLRAVTAGGS